MCESCHGGLDRRRFLISSGVLGTVTLLADRVRSEETVNSVLPSREKQAPKVAVVFLYPPADVVNAGQNEDDWHVHKWFTWPGNQYQPEQQQAKFTQKINEIAQRLGIEVHFHPQAIYQRAKMEQFIGATKAAQVDTVLVVNFWNSFAALSHEIATQSAPTAIVYQPLGSNHQLPSEALRKTEGMFFIHSIENWAEIERGLRAVRASKMMRCSRLLRISGRVQKVEEIEEADLGTRIVNVPAEEYNRLFDSIQPDTEMTALAKR
ncbi:MAG: hypothetical protein JW829_21490, partial [Pirellulales bacterium]|nr:hypothetical protein [Pirellulales bacterium]